MSRGPEVLVGDALHYSTDETHILRDVSISIGRGEVVAIVGPSGSGKSTLLACLSGVLVPTSGTVALAGVALEGLSAVERAEVRLRTVGFVFQFSELVPELSLVDNVSLPLWLGGRARAAARRDAYQVLSTLGIAAAVADRRPSSVSGGEMQRAAVARALVHDPQVVFADEPTGALDSVTAAAVMHEILDAAAQRAAAVVVVTHDERVAGRADRVLEMRDGRLGAL